MIIIYNLLPILFILNIIYFIKNRDYLQKSYSEKDTSDIRVSELVYYYINLIYYFFILFGLLIDNTYWLLLLTYFIKFPIYHINKRVYSIYSYVYPYLSILFLLYLLYSKFL
jgi:hypothetical protein